LEVQPFTAWWRRPATLALLLGNLALGSLWLTPNALGNNPAWWALHYGKGLHLHEWFTSSFVHDSASHLIGNLIWLAAVAWLLESEVGWRRTLQLYLGLMLALGAIEQGLSLLIKLPGTGSYGSSTLIFALLGVVLLHAGRRTLLRTSSGLSFRLWHAVVAFYVADVVVDGVSAWSFVAECHHVFGLISGLTAGLLTRRSHIGE
jgi:membrane associated rhomboid family serine protease